MTRMLRRTSRLLLCGAALSTMPAVAQNPPAPVQNDAPPPYGGPHRGGPEHRVDMLQRQLNLTPDQTTQVKALFADEHTKMEALHSNTSLTADDRHTQMMAIHQDGETKLKALLTPDQVTKYNEMQARMREHMQERNQQSAAPPPAAAPQN